MKFMASSHDSQTNSKISSGISVRKGWIQTFEDALLSYGFEGASFGLTRILAKPGNSPSFLGSVLRSLTNRCGGFREMKYQVNFARENQGQARTEINLCSSNWICEDIGCTTSRTGTGLDLKMPRVRIL